MQRGARAVDIDYRDVVSGLSEGVAIIDRDGVVLELNASAERILGVPAEYIVGERLLDLTWQTVLRDGSILPREDHPSFVAVRESAIQPEQVLGMTNPSVLQTVWVACTAHPLYRNGESAPWASATSFRDVTLQVRAEEGRDTALSHFLSLTTALEEGVMLEDARGRIVLANRAFCRMFALDTTADALEGGSAQATRDAAAKLSRDPDAYLADIDALLHKRERSVGQPLALRDGRVLERNYLPIEMDAAQPGNLWIFRDVTDRHRAERLKDEMIGLVSHELRNPLSSIFGSLRLLGSTALQMTSQQSKLLEVAVRNTDLLMRLVNDLLEIDRIESGAIPMDLEDVSVEDLMSDAQMATSGLAAAASIDITLRAEPGLVRADHDRILQVLINLISNATKFSEPGGHVRVTNAQRFEKMLFAVVDEGRGIPAELRESVFNRFEQVDRKDGSRGAGLGLYICKMIVQQHGGDIWTEPTAGGGSTFYFTVPLSSTPL